MISPNRLKEMALEDIENNPEKYLEETAELLQQFDQLKKENEELKTEFDKFEEQIKLQGNFIDNFLFATKNSEWRNKSILEDEADAIIEKVESDYVQLENYKQALQEIKDYCNKYPQNSIGFKKQILQKCEVINE